MEPCEVIPGATIGTLHVLKKTGSLNGIPYFLCRDEKGINRQISEVKILSCAVSAPESVEMAAKEEIVLDATDNIKDVENSQPESFVEVKSEVVPEVEEVKPKKSSRKKKGGK